jgi:hypothetical protein
MRGKGKKLRQRAALATGCKAAKARIAPITKKVTKAGVVKLTLKLNAAAKALLKRKGKLAITLRTTFTPTAGAPLTKTTKTTLLAPPKPRCNVPSRCHIKSRRLR